MVFNLLTRMVEAFVHVVGEDTKRWEAYELRIEQLSAANQKLADQNWQLECDYNAEKAWRERLELTIEKLDYLYDGTVNVYGPNQFLTRLKRAEELADETLERKARQ